MLSFYLFLCKIHIHKYKPLFGVGEEGKMCICNFKIFSRLFLYLLCCNVHVTFYSCVMMICYSLKMKKLMKTKIQKKVLYFTLTDTLQRSMWYVGFFKNFIILQD